MRVGLPAWMDRAHRLGQVGMGFDSDGLLNMVLAYVLIHLLNGQWLSVLKKECTCLFIKTCDSFSILITTKPMYKAHPCIRRTPNFGY